MLKKQGSPGYPVVYEEDGNAPQCTAHLATCTFDQRPQKRALAALDHVVAERRDQKYTKHTPDSALDHELDIQLSDIDIQLSDIDIQLSDIDIQLSEIDIAFDSPKIGLKEEITIFKKSLEGD